MMLRMEKQKVRDENVGASSKQRGAEMDERMKKLRELIQKEQTLNFLNKEINVGQPRAGMESSRVFSRAEVLVPIGCDVHPWMRANLAVLAHPFFAVSGEAGAFEIRNVPPGTYEVEARHGKLKPVSATVVVAGAETPVDLTLVIP